MYLPPRYVTYLHLTFEESLSLSLLPVAFAFMFLLESLKKNPSPNRKSRCGTLSYEIYYAFTTTSTPFERLSFLIWFLLDLTFALVALFTAYPSSRRKLVGSRLFLGTLLGLTFLHFLCRKFPDEREQVTAYWTGLLLQLPIGWGSLIHLLKRDNGTKGHSLEIW